MKVGAVMILFHDYKTNLFCSKLVSLFDAAPMMIFVTPIYGWTRVLWYQNRQIGPLPPPPPIRLASDHRLAK